MLKWYFQGRDIPKTSTRVQNSDVGKNSTPAAESPDEGKEISLDLSVCVCACAHMHMYMHVCVGVCVCDKYN